MRVEALGRLKNISALKSSKAKPGTRGANKNANLDSAP